MNSSKKIVREGATVKNKKSEAEALSVVDRKRLVIGIIFAVIVVVLCVGVGIQEFKKDTVLKVNNTKYTMDDMMWPIYEVESQYLAMDSMYQYYMNTSVWDASYSGGDANVPEGSTNADGLKIQVMNQTQEYEILYQEAVKNDYKLTEEEKQKAKSDAKDALKYLSFTQKLKLSISEGKLTDLMEKRALAMRYSDDRRAETDKTVDEDAAKKTVNKDDYKQYDVQYYYVSTVTKEGEELKPEKYDKRLKQLKDVYERMEDNDKFAELLEEKDKADQVKFEKASYTEKDGWSLITNKDVMKKIKKLKVGDVTEVIEDKDDKMILFVRLKDDTSTESYDKACEEAVTTAKDEKYNEWFKELQGKYTIKVYDKVWDDIEIGTVTTSIVNEEDLQKMQEEREKDNPSSEGASSDATATSDSSEAQ